MFWDWFKKKPQRVYHRPQVEMSPEARAMTIKMDPKRVTDDIVKDIRRQVADLPEVPAEERKFVADQAVESVREGGNLHRLSWALSEAGVEKPEASRITRGIHNRATAMINRNRQIATGIYTSEWLHSRSPCFVAFQGDVDGQAQDLAHREVNGKRFDIRKGLKINGKWTSPGMEWGCKCTSRIILSGFND